MERMTFTITWALAMLAITGAACAAEISISPNAGQATRFFADVPLRVDVRVSALEVSEKDFARINWLDYVELGVRDAGKNAVAVSVTSRNQLAEVSTENHSARAGREKERLWTARGSLVLAPLPAGRLTLSATYRGITSSPVTIVVQKGDEDNATIAARLAVDAARHGIPFEEYRAIQLRRLELLPTNEDILWELGWAARFSAEVSCEEIDSYYSRAIEVERARLALLRDSGDEGLRRHAEAEQPGFETRERIAGAIRSLLPEFCKRRDALWIGWSADEKNIELQERATHRAIRSIDITTPRRDRHE